LLAPVPEPSPGFVPEGDTPELVPPVASGVGAVVDPDGPTDPVLPMPVVLVLLPGVVVVVDAVLGVVTVVLDVRSDVRIDVQPAASAAAAARPRRWIAFITLPSDGC
jgi:hypothetical protein